MKIHALWLGASVLALAWGGVAQAQSASPASKDNAPKAAGLGEVVVTAERRTENLQQTAIAASVLTEQDLIKNGVLRVDQLQFVTPSLAVDNFGQGNDIDIRGIGKGEHNTQTGTGVVTYRDGVASFPGYFQEEPYYDVSSVEVLRGPQGTFNGQNSTGGAVIVNTQNPVIGGGYDGYLLGHYGNYNDTGLQGAVNVPISSTFAARFAFNTDYRDTFYNIAGLIGDPNLRWGSARLSLLWNPSSNFKAVLKVDYNFLSNGGYFGDAIINPLTGTLNPTSSLFNFSNNYQTSAIDQFVRAVLRMDYTLPGDVTLRTVSGFQQGHSGWNGDIDGTNLPAPNYIINEALSERTFSQEVNLISPDKGPFTWVLGGYYQHDRDNFPYFDIGVPPGGFDEDLVGPNNTHTLAAFGQVSFNLPDGFQLQGGLRYSKWSTTNHVLFYVPEFSPFLDQMQDQTFTGDNLTGKVTLNWKLDNDNFLYAFVATGAKPGGLNTSLYTFPQTAIPAPFGQEYVTDYEIGWKSRLLDGHLRTQVGAYYNNFDHFQVIIPLPNNPLLSTEQNDPSGTKLYGLEASAQAALGALSLNASVGIEHSELGAMFAQDPRRALAGTCNLQTGPATATCINLSGHPQTYAPDFTFNVSAQYDFKLANGDTLTPGVTYAHVSSQWGSLFDNVAAGDYLTPRNILGASLSWTHG
ncbi:MAG TPA: TonB-dependent receptor, partial [Caulobacteraceae bacterium]